MYHIQSILFICGDTLTGQTRFRASIFCYHQQQYQQKFDCLASAIIEPQPSPFLVRRFSQSLYLNPASCPHPQHPTAKGSS